MNGFVGYIHWWSSNSGLFGENNLQKLRQVNLTRKKKDNLIKMNQKELSQLTDEELLEAAKNNKPSPIIDAFFIGFLVGIIIYSVAANTWGFLTLIPLYLIYVFLKKPKKVYNDAITPIFVID